MLPRSYNSGYSNDIRGFRKKNRFLKLYQQYAPYVAAAELILLIVISLTLSANVKHERTVVTRLTSSHKSKELEIRTISNTLESERRSRLSAENGYRETSSQLSAVKRQLSELETSHQGKEQHSRSLQQSFDWTKEALEGERDAVKRDLEEARKRILDLETQVAHKDQTIDAHKLVASKKDQLHADREQEWEAMREQLEGQLRKQGDFIPQHTSGSDPAARPDYSAKEGSAAFHLTSEGKKERYLDTAKDLTAIGVVDPKGVEHLAQLMGHLVDIKQAEYTAIQKAYPADNPPPRPPIGHWMAMNLERMGVLVPHGTLHLSYFLDAHFALINNTEVVGKLAEDPKPDLGVENSATGSSNNASSQLEAHPDVQATQASPRNNSQDSQAESAKLPDGNTLEDPLANLKRGRKGHRVDAAGFI